MIERRQEAADFHQTKEPKQCILFGIYFCKGRVAFDLFTQITPKFQLIVEMTMNRYGRSYDDDPVWTTQNNSDYQPRVSPYSVPHTHSVIGANVPPNNAPQHTTIVHSSIKAVPDSDIYRFVN